MKNLTEGKEIKVILHFATPMLIGYIFQQVYLLGDTFVLGRLISKEAMSASGAVFPLIFLISSSITGFASAATIIISQFFGARKLDKTPLVISTLLITSILGGILISIIALVTAKPILRLMHLPADVFPLATVYFNTLMYGSAFIFGYTSIAAVFRGFGDSKTPVFLSITSNIINLSLDFFFVAGLKKGVASVALATVIAYSVAFFIAFWILYRRLKKHKLLIKPQFSKKFFQKLFKLGIPSSFQMSFVAIAFFLIYTYVNFFGTNVLAAFSALTRINSLAISPSLILASAMTSFAGQNYGAKLCLRLRNGLRQTLISAGVLAISLSIILYSFPRQFIGFFTTDRQVIAIGISYLRIVSPFYIFFYSSRIILGLITGLGDTMSPMKITWATIFGIRLPVAFFGAFRVHFSPFKIIPHNYKGIWWGEPVNWIAGLLLAIKLYFKKYNKYLKTCGN